MNDFAYQFTIAIATVVASFFGYELDEPSPPQPAPVVQEVSTFVAEVDFTRAEDGPPLTEFPLVATLPDGTEFIQDDYSAEFGPWRCQFPDGLQTVYGGKKPAALVEGVTCWPENETRP